MEKIKFIVLFAVIFVFIFHTICFAKEINLEYELEYCRLELEKSNEIAIAYKTAYLKEKDLNSEYAVLLEEYQIKYEQKISLLEDKIRLLELKIENQEKINQILKEELKSKDRQLKQSVILNCLLSIAFVFML